MVNGCLEGVESRVASCDSCVCLSQQTHVVSNLPLLGTWHSRHSVTSPLVTPNSVVVTFLHAATAEVDVAKSTTPPPLLTRTYPIYLTASFSTRFFFNINFFALFFGFESVTLLVRFVVERWEG